MAEIKRKLEQRQGMELRLSIKEGLTLEIKKLSLTRSSEKLRTRVKNFKVAKRCSMASYGKIC